MEKKEAFMIADVIILILLILTVIFIIYIIIMNLFLIIAIFKDRTMRGRLFFQLILLIAVAHFLQGVSVIPLHVALGFSGGGWSRHTDICTFIHLVDLTLTFVLSSLFLVLMFERFFSLTYPQIVTNRCIGLLMLSLPWILSTAYVVFLYYALPVYLLQAMVNINVIDGTVETCNLGYYVQGIYSVVGFLCPASFTFGFSWANVVILCLLKQSPSEGDVADKSRTQTYTASVIALCFIVMWFPSNSGMILPDEISSSMSFTFSLYFGFANAALTPSLWLILSEMKHGFHRVCCCCCTACCPSSRRNHGDVVSSALDDNQLRMLEWIEPTRLHSEKHV